MTLKIKVTGLRPGEKLYEELLIEGASSNTQHPRIFTADECCLPEQQLQSYLAQFELAAAQGDLATIQQVLLEAVQGYQPKRALLDVSLPLKNAN